MADYTTSKDGHGQQWDVNVVEQAFGALEPLLTAETFKSRFLWGISLVSGVRDPITRRAEVMGADQLTDAIDRAIAEAEAQCHITIMPSVVDEKHAFDLSEYRSWGYFRLRHRPVSSIEYLSVTPSNDADIYVVPLEWVETTYMYLGQINIIPLTIAVGAGGNTTVPTTASGSAMFLSMFGTQSWVPAFWRMKYTIGFKDGLLPKIINELIGIIAAQDVLSRLASTYGRNTGNSLSMDGISQSVSSPGQEMFSVRQTQLEDRRKRLVSKIKTRVGQSIFSGNV
jgi:hypothetical protein